MNGRLADGQAAPGVSPAGGAAPHQAALLLGSNIEPQANLPRALEQLEALFLVLGVSQVYETPAVGSSGPNFLNAALLIQTGLEPGELKEGVLRPLERGLGRQRAADKNAARPIDIDIIAWDGRLLDPSAWRHAHLAVPLAELLPELRSAGQAGSLQQAAERLRRLQPIWLRKQVFHQAHRHDRRADDARPGVHAQDR